jgi:hypothetical protein
MGALLAELKARTRYIAGARGVLVSGGAEVVF